jgi:hypothetical protein
VSLVFSRMETLRVLADVALLVPVLVFLAASQSPR